MPGADARTAPAPGSALRPRRSRGTSGLVFVVALAVYANALADAFLWDDVHLVVGNPADQALGGAGRASSCPISSRRRSRAATTVRCRRSATRSTTGSGASPPRVSISPTSSCTPRPPCCSFASASRVLGATAAALAAALLFAVHPLHVEAVTYVAGRSDPLAAVFLLLAVLGFLRGDGRGRALSVAAFFLRSWRARRRSCCRSCCSSIDRMPPASRAVRSARYLPYGLALALYLVLRAVGVARRRARAGDRRRAARPPPADDGVRRRSHYLGLVVVPRGLHMERVVTPVASPLEPRRSGRVMALALLVAGDRGDAARGPGRSRSGSRGSWWRCSRSRTSCRSRPSWPSTGSTCRSWDSASRPAGRRRRCRRAAVAASAAMARGGDRGRRATAGSRYVGTATGATRGRSTSRSAAARAREHARPGRPRGGLSGGGRARPRARRLRGSRAAPAERAGRRPTRSNNLGNIERDAGRATRRSRPTTARSHCEPAPRRGAERACARRSRPSVASTKPSATLAPRSRSRPTRRSRTATSATSTSAATSWSARATQYLAAVRLDPDHADAHNNLGSAYFRLGDRARAEAEYRTALRLDPRSTGAERNLAIVLGRAARGPPGP